MNEPDDRDIICTFASPGRIVKPPKRDNLLSELSNSKYQGIKSMPWLVLTGKEHFVTAEGFGLSELNQKITETENAKK